MSDGYTGVVSGDFLEQIRQALNNLYNFSFLNQLTVAEDIATQLGSPDSSGKTLRRELILAIESLNPGSDVYFRSPDGRFYHLLNLHYIGRMTIKEVAIELAVSERQVYRDLKRGQEVIAEILWDKFMVTPQGSSSIVQAELTRLKDHIRDVNLGELLLVSIGAVQRLAAQHEVELIFNSPDDPIIIATNLPIAQQIITKLLSNTIKATAQPIQIAILQNSHHIRVRLEYYPSQTGRSSNEFLEQLVGQIKWQMWEEMQGEKICLTLQITTHACTALVIDDNEGIAELINRFLATYNCQVISTTSSTKGLDLALNLLPDVIFLDVMMPNIDGWELLQHLRSYAEIEETPIIICSVLNDPELAFSLGASLVLAKPITQEKVIHSLKRIKLI